MGPFVLGPSITKVIHMAHPPSAGPFLPSIFKTPHSSSLLSSSLCLISSSHQLHVSTIICRTSATMQSLTADIVNLSCNPTATTSTGTIHSSTNYLAGEFKDLSCKFTATTNSSADDDIASDFDNLNSNTASGIANVEKKQSSQSTKPYTLSSESDRCRDAINRVEPDGSNRALGMEDIRFVRRVGSGDIGSVYVAEVKGWEGECVFAAKVMDKEELMSRKKEERARTEREILEMLDHPFLPTLYAAIESSRWCCLMTEFCPGGDVHVLRQRQPLQRFHEDAVRFYASEVVIALEYLHMMGIIYRDLKPENVLIRSDGHIMLTDFDLSLKADDSSTSTVQIVFDHHLQTHTNQSSSAMSSCILPNCIVPTVSCFHPKRNRKKTRSTRCGSLEIIAEPIEIRSMSFVGTHEYLAPEIISGEGHGNAVDWWTLGVFMFELLYGITPFKGLDNELTLANIVARALEFPKEPMVAEPVKDLIAKLLVKDPTKRLGSTMGATAIKHHPYFNGVNWALLRCASPPYKPPPPAVCKDLVQLHNGTTNQVDYY